MNVYRIHADPRQPSAHARSSRTLHDGVGRRNSLRGLVCLVLLGGLALSALETPTPPTPPRAAAPTMPGEALAIVQARLDPARLQTDREASAARANGR